MDGIWFEEEAFNLIRGKESDIILPKWEEVMSIFGLIGEKKGGHFEILCINHKEKTPSLYLYPTNNHKNYPHFYCYGCGVSGSLIHFIMHMINRNEIPDTIEGQKKFIRNLLEEFNLSWENPNQLIFDFDFDFEER